MTKKLFLIFSVFAFSAMAQPTAQYAYTGNVKLDIAFLQELDKKPLPLQIVKKPGADFEIMFWKDNVMDAYLVSLTPRGAKKAIFVESVEHSSIPAVQAVKLLRAWIEAHPEALKPAPPRKAVKK